MQDGFVGIQFEDHFQNDIQILEKVMVALRLPQHLRLYGLIDYFEK